jgi:hypothetical protein
MRPPEILRRQTLWSILSVDEMHELMAVEVENNFDRFGENLPTWALQLPHELIWLRTFFSDDREKWAVVQTVKAMLAATGAIAYSFSFEAFVSVYQRHEMDENGRPEKMPSEREESKRDNVCLLFTHRRTGGDRMSQYLVNVRTHGRRNFLGPRQDLDGQYANQTGNLMNLFRQEDFESAAEMFRKARDELFKGSRQT